MTRRWLSVPVLLVLPLALAAPAAAATQPATQAAQHQPPQPSKSAISRHPVFVHQPHLDGRRLSVTVKVRAWHATRQWAKQDRLAGHLSISKRGFDIRRVTLGPTSRARHLVYDADLPRRKLAKTGEVTSSVTLPKKVAASLRNTPADQWRTRIRWVVWQQIDSMKPRKGLDLTLLAQSYLKADRPRADKRGQLAAASNDPTGLLAIANETPFNVELSLAGTQCVQLPQVTLTGPNESTQWISTKMTIQTSSGNISGESAWKNATQGAVEALRQSATTAATGRSSSLVGAGAKWAIDFLVDFFKDASKNACYKNPQTWVTSWVNTGVYSTKGYSAINFVDGAGDPLTYITGAQAASSAQLAADLGAQSSVQWSWNGGNITTSGMGSSYFTSGLTSLAYTGIYDSENAIIQWLGYNVTAAQGYGPIPAAGSQTMAATWVTPSELTLSCTVGDYNLDLPPTSDDPNGPAIDLGNPPAGLNLSAYEAVTFYYDAVTPGGQQLTFQSLPPEVTSTVQAGFSTTQPVQISLDAAALQDLQQQLNGAQITDWGCSTAASAQVPAYPALGLGNLNLGWNSWPGNIATTPYTAPPAS